MLPQSLEFLRAIVSEPSPSGYEQGAAELFRQEAGKYADEVTTDILGNVVAALNPGASMKITLSAHMDEIGFIIHFIDEEGLLYFSTIGGHDSVIPVGQRVWVQGRERVAGVVGRKAIHMLGPDEVKNKPGMTDLWIDIGAGSRAAAESVVQLGDVATFQYEFQHLMGMRATARAFDNKAGVFVLAEALRLLKEEPGLDPDVGVYAVASVQEEIGSRGAQTSSFGIGPQCGLAIDMGQAVDYPGVSKAEHGQLDLGKGPGVSRGPNTNHAVFALLIEAARKGGIPHQVSVTPGASPTDAKVMQTSRSGMAAGLLEIPLRYMHTPCEVLSLDDLDNAARLAAAFCRLVTPETDFRPGLARLRR